MSASEETWELALRFSILFPYECSASGCTPAWHDSLQRSCNCHYTSDSFELQSMSLLACSPNHEATVVIWLAVRHTHPVWQDDTHNLLFVFSFKLSTCACANNVVVACLANAHGYNFGVCAGECGAFRSAGSPFFPN